MRKKHTNPLTLAGLKAALKGLATKEGLHTLATQEALNSLTTKANTGTRLVEPRSSARCA